jgi:16S rRNA (guanine527-N7)-methyltransferase
VNTITGAPSLPAARPAPATVPLHSESTWSGLGQEAERIGVPLDDNAVALLGRYRDLLLESISRFNLTAIRDPVEVERRLFLDALAMIPTIWDFLTDRPHTSGHPRLIDVGSGAGFPGLVLKIAIPELGVTLIEATGKKVRFLEQVIAELSLQSVRAIHGRAEDLGQDSRYRERFDLATARAVAALPTLLELVTPFLDVGGEGFLPKGTQLDEELRAGRRAAAKLGAEIISTPLNARSDSRLVIVRKTSLTPKRYPRRSGLPNQSPLGIRG